LKRAQLPSEAGVVGGAMQILNRAEEARANGIDVEAASQAVEAAAIAGNASASTTLYRYLSSPAAGQDGAARLAALVAKNPDLVPLNERVQAASSLADFAKFSEEVKTADENRRAFSIRQVRSGNVNAYVYLVQDLLAGKALYSGPKNGLLTGSTITAFNRYCKDKGIYADCLRGPISGFAVKAFSEAISNGE
jgi:hypothetical protein